MPKLSVAGRTAPGLTTARLCNARRAVFGLPVLRSKGRPLADIADVLDALEQIARTACYPNGTSLPSVSGKPIDVAQGWVLSEDLDAGLPQGMTFVTVYAVPSSTAKLPVPLSGSSDGVVVAPVHGMSAVVSDLSFTLSGVPTLGEYATVIVGAYAYSYPAAAGDTVQIVAAALAAQIPGAAVSGSTVSLRSGPSITVRIGAPATMGRTIDRERQNVILGVWAPNPSDRTVVAAALRVAVAQNLTIVLPDTSEALLIAQGMNQTDKNQLELAWRRDLTVQVTFDTLETYPAYEVTSVDVTLDAGAGQPTSEGNPPCTNSS